MGELRYDLLYELFEMYLHRHGCYDAFVSQIRGGLTLYVYVSRHKDKPYGLMQCAFKWDRSREGFAYWDVYDSGWQRLVDALIGD